VPSRCTLYKTVKREGLPCNGKGKNDYMSSAEKDGIQKNPSRQTKRTEIKRRQPCQKPIRDLKDNRETIIHSKEKRGGEGSIKWGGHFEGTQ